MLQIQTFNEIVTVENVTITYKSINYFQNVNYHTLHYHFWSAIIILKWKTGNGY